MEIKYLNLIQMSMFSHKILTIIFLTSLLHFINTQPIEKLQLTTNYNFTQPQSSYSYFQTTFNQTKDLFMITIDEQKLAFLTIYVSINYNNNSTYYQLPNQTHHDIECDQSNFDTCIIKMQSIYNKDRVSLEVTVYFSIHSYESIDYQLMVSCGEYYEVNINRPYRLNFNHGQSGVVKIKGQQISSYEQFVMILTYDTSGVAGQFKIKAALNQIPSSTSRYDTTYTGVTVGAFNKILKLPKISSNDVYYVLIEGQKDSKLQMKFYDSTPSAPVIKMNSSVIYETNKSLSYMVHSPLTNIQLPLFIRLYSFSGYGVFRINYCNKFLELKIQKTNGENEEITISPYQRKACKDSISAMMNGSFGLLIENIEIRVENVNYRFGFQIAVSQGLFLSKLRLNQQIYGYFIAEQDLRIYQIEIPAEHQMLSINIIQSQNIHQQYLYFQTVQCKKNKKKQTCNLIDKVNGSTHGLMNIFIEPQTTYYLNITYPNKNKTSPFLEYHILLYNQKQSQTYLLPSKLYLQELHQNESSFYIINFTKLKDENFIKIKNLTQVTIIIKQINGNTIMTTSLTTPKPSYEKYLLFNSDIKFIWNGEGKYIVNQTTQVIYIGIRAEQACLFYLHYTVNVDADIPIKYQRIADGTLHNYELTSKAQYKLISFSPHIIPFYPMISGKPSCIRYGHSLPLSQTCYTKLPQSLGEKMLYLNISNGEITKQSFKFSIYISSGEYFLNNNNPILMGCMDTCFQFVNVLLLKQSNIIHKGRGQICDLKNINNIVSNSFIKLTCQEYPCWARLNASLPYGGQMQLFMQNQQIIEINWKAKPITFGNYPKKLIYPIHPWSDVNSLLIYSQALQLTAFYNIINLHEHKSNIIQYSFPTSTAHEKSSTSNPLRNTHLIQIDHKMIKQKQCKNINNFCMVVISLYPNQDIQYNLDYFERGIGLVSSNVNHYFVYLNTPMEYQERLSMNYFSYRLQSSQIHSNMSYRVNIEPVSDCHPKIYPGSNMKNINNTFQAQEYINPMFQVPSYDDLVLTNTGMWMNFTILTQKICKYTVSLTNTNYQFLVSNKFYQFERQNSQLIVLYRHTDWKLSQFTIQSSTGFYFNKIKSINVNKIINNKIILPTSTNRTFGIQNNSLLIINPTDYNQLFLIKINFQGNRINLLIRKDGPLILTSYQEHLQKIAKNQIMSYRLYTSGCIALFITTNAQHPQVTINKNYNTTKVFSTTITTKSNSWVHVNSEHGQLNMYDITINNDGQEDIIITVKNQQNDALSYAKLYEGIILYDAFSTKNEYNCYYYQTGFLLGHKKIKVDLVIKPQYIQGQNLEIHYKAFIQNNLLNSQMQVYQTNPYVFRLTLDYIINQNYTICFTSPNFTIEHIQYYILVNDPNMQHLVENYVLTKIADKPYEMFQIIEQGYNDDLIITLTNCYHYTNNQKILVGSSSFTDSSVGRFTDLSQYYKNHQSIYARLSVNQGYYYLGVKHNISQNQNQNLYSIKFQNVKKTDANLVTQWQLKDRKIVKIFKSNPTNKIHIQLPQLHNKQWKGDNNANVTIAYTIFVINLKSYQDITPLIELKLLARCPFYPNNTFIQTIKDKGIFIENNKYQSYQNVTDYNKKRKAPVFQFDYDSFPQHFNITGKITVYSQGQSVQYHYQTIQTTKTGSMLQIGQDKVSPALIVVIVITLICILGAASFVIYQKRKNAEEKKKVVFELNTVNEKQQENATARRQNRQSLFASHVNSKPPKYEEFADEINS